MNGIYQSINQINQSEIAKWPKYDQTTGIPKAPNFWCLTASGLTTFPVSKATTRSSTVGK